MNFENFEIQKRISKIVRAQKLDEKNRVIQTLPFSFLRYDP